MQKLVPIGSATYSLEDHEGLIPLDDGHTSFTFIDQRKHRLIVSSAVPPQSRDHVIALLVATACGLEQTDLSVSRPHVPAFFRRLRQPRGPHHLSD